MERGSTVKYSALWLSHSSIGDYLKCPRLYFLRNVYKDPLSGHKITQITPPLALGQAVHEVIEGLSNLPVEERFNVPLAQRLDKAWAKISEDKGGFVHSQEEKQYKERGLEMLERVEKNPGPVGRRAVKIRADSGLPNYFISEEEMMILCGKIDWLEYIDKKDAVSIVDFKTGKWEEETTSLQLPIYYLIVKNTQKREVEKAYYWYIDRDSEPRQMELPDADKAKEEVMQIGKRIKLARQLNRFVCPDGGCKYCLPMEKIAGGGGKLVGISEYKQDIYIIK